MPAVRATIDVKAQLTRANLGSAHRYLPLGCRAGGRGLAAPRARQGHVERCEARRSPAISRSFRSRAGRAASSCSPRRRRTRRCDYADDWPPITEIAGDVRIEGAAPVDRRIGGRVLGARIGATRAEIADLHDPRPVLQIDGIAERSDERIPRVRRANADRRMDRSRRRRTRRPTGDGRLALKFDLPLRDMGGVKVNGQYRFASNGVRLAGRAAR